MDMAESLPPELGAHDCIEAKQVHAPNSAEPQVAICSSIDLSGTEQVQDEWIEHYEPGVYIMLKTLSDGTWDLKRVRFR